MKPIRIVIAVAAPLVLAGASMATVAAHAPKAAPTHVTTVKSVAGPTAPQAETETTTETATEPAGAAGRGHTDEVPGATTESNVDHQFNGQE
jgi:hypothetical protein